MTVKIKMAFFSIFSGGFGKILSQPHVELHGQGQNDKVEQM